MKWRDIPACDIDWGQNPISKRAGYKVRMMCVDIYLNKFSDKFSCGAWHNVTLGEIADYGPRHWRRCTNIGDLAVEVIKWVIDEAALGRCPLCATAGPAHDAYIPKSERALKRLADLGQEYDRAADLADADAPIVEGE